MPSLVTHFCDFLLRVAGASTPAPSGLRVLERASLFGLLADVLDAPLVPTSKGAISTDHVGSKNLIVETSVRALAFMPSSKAVGGSKWGEHLFRYTGFLDHLGRPTAYMLRMEEYFPGWLAEADRVEPENKPLASTDHLPWLDASTPLTLDGYYQPHES